ncbi:peptidoglycan-binding domain-containing protein [Chenggangzhangella methanolivorans]|uniref:Peptidoglycan-binding protein n=1 Tax=Chenggangzhangella methanolivorans TaxID=1437009 RepID=A0A9E6RD08_9HYPH|nr:peptidoglycan-binding domain-containing protein [Chenggangzhangella methanolivorans]QZO02080.1 peptidoglycan-binding protein [Chenggangzhangella methanolivorans]
MLLFRDGTYAAEPMVTVLPASDAGAVLWSKGRRVPILPLLGAGDASAQPTVPADRITIRRGDKGPVVAEWQRIIGVYADGDFGSKTEAVTMAFQKARGLVPDGIVGSKTWGAAA